MISTHLFVSFAVVLALPVSTFAATLPPDVSESDWFAPAIQEFTAKKYLNTTVFVMPTSFATRAEFVRLMVNLKGGASSSLPSVSSFKDTTSAEFEEAARQGWMKGVGNCLGKPGCTANPNGKINRAEAAALLSRAFSITAEDSAPTFTDAPTGQWFSEAVRNAAGACILKGDGSSKKVRPSDFMNRAEMYVMLYRLHAKLRYPHCDATIPADVLPLAPEKPSLFSSVSPSSISSLSGKRSSLSSIKNSMGAYNYEAMPQRKLERCGDIVTLASTACTANQILYVHKNTQETGEISVIVESHEGLQKNAAASIEAAFAKTKIGTTLVKGHNVYLAHSSFGSYYYWLQGNQTITVSTATLCSPRSVKNDEPCSALDDIAQKYLALYPSSLQKVVAPTSSTGTASSGESSIRNTQRRADINVILNAVSQYDLDTGGKLAPTLPTVATEICVMDAKSCAGMVNLAVLKKEYLSFLFRDPSIQTGDGTRYFIMKDTKGHITVSAPFAEGGVTISVTR